MNSTLLVHEKRCYLFKPFTNSSQLLSHFSPFGSNHVFQSVQLFSPGIGFLSVGEDDGLNEEHFLKYFVFYFMFSFSKCFYGESFLLLSLSFI